MDVQNVHVFSNSRSNNNKPYICVNIFNVRSTLRVVPLGPVVPGSGLAKDEVVRPEYLPVGTGADGVHRPGLEVEEDGPGDVLAARGLVVVDLLFKI